MHLQVRDLRSAVVREACDSIERMGVLHPKLAALAADELFESLLKLTYVTKEVDPTPLPRAASSRSAVPRDKRACAEPHGHPSAMSCCLAAGRLGRVS